jgi:hypothetical protein
VIVILFICKSIWHFPVPVWMWFVAAIDGVSSSTNEIKNIIRKDR